MSADASHWAYALEVLLRHEGGFVDHPSDPGGATQFGISLRWLRRTGKLDVDGDGIQDGDLDGDGDIDVDDVRRLTRERAATLYRHHFWDAHRLGEIHDREIAAKALSLVVNMPARVANRQLQRAVRSATDIVLVEDGTVGEKTLAAVNAAAPAVLLAAHRSEAAGHYRRLAAARQDLAEFLPGWLNRAYE